MTHYSALENHWRILKCNLKVINVEKPKINLMLPIRRLVLIEVFPFLSFFYSLRSSLWSPLSFPLVINVYPFSHQGIFLRSLRIFPLVIKVPLLHLHFFEVMCVKERTKNELTDRTESRTMSVISIDVNPHLHLQTCFSRRHILPLCYITMYILHSTMKMLHISQNYTLT